MFPGDVLIMPRIKRKWKTMFHDTYKLYFYFNLTFSGYSIEYILACKLIKIGKVISP